MVSICLMECCLIIYPRITIIIYCHDNPMTHIEGSHGDR